MSIHVDATYSKRCGLPRFSSHQFCVSIRAEVTSLRGVERETGRLYRILQASVDRQIEQVGFLPDAKYGIIVEVPPAKNGASASNGKNGHNAATHTSSAGVSTVPIGSGWACSDKQRALIEKVAKEQKFTGADLDGIAGRLFQLPVQRLNTRQASGFIGELLAIAGPPPRYQRPPKRAAAPVAANASR